MGGNSSILGQKDKYSSLLLKQISIAGIFLPIVSVLYALLSHYNFIDRSEYYDPTISALICLGLMAVSIVQYFTYTRSNTLIFAYLILYHILGGLFLIFISGFMDAPTVFWIPMMVVADLYYGKRGLLYSGAGLLAVALVIVASEPELDLALTINHLAYAGSIVILGYFVSLLKIVQATEHVDLMKSKQIQGRQQGQLETIVNSLGESVMSLNAAGIIQIYNAATLNMFDTNQSLAGKHIDDVMHLYQTDGEPLKLYQLLKTSTTSMQWDDFEHRYDDGEEIRLGITTSIVKNNTPQSKNHTEGYIVLMRDITKSKSLEEERDEFISVVSHELRTPITIAEGALSNVQLLMERGADKKLLTSTVDSAHEQILFLAKMVNDLSTLSRAERGVADAPELINVSELMHDLYAQYAPKAQEKGLALDLDAPGKIHDVVASRLYLEEILQNFITNAIKYTQKGQITMSIKSTKDTVSFAVKDSGIGISKPDQKKIFQKFYRSEDYRTRETSGTGLGLYVVHKLARKLGTDVVLVSRLNHGSTFSFTLPVALETIDEKTI